MSKKLIQEVILEKLPLQYRYLHEVDYSVDNDIPFIRVTKNEFYDSLAVECISNYRNTSKILDVNDL